MPFTLPADTEKEELIDHVAPATLRAVRAYIGYLIVQEGAFSERLDKALKKVPCTDTSLYLKLSTFKDHSNTRLCIFFYYSKELRDILFEKGVATL